MSLRDRIINELRSKRIMANHLWFFQQYMAFCNRLESEESKLFYDEMEKMCNEGLFKKEEKNRKPAYRVTELCEKILYTT